MPHISSSLIQFARSLDRQEAVIGDKKTGTWQKEGSLDRLVRWIDGRTDQRLLSIGKLFCAALDDFEKTPIHFYKDPLHPIKQNYYCHNYLKAAEAVTKTLKTSHSIEVQKQLGLVEQKIIALQYRMEASNGGWERAKLVDASLLENVLLAASVWKDKQPFRNGALLTERDAQSLEETCHYPQFAKLLLAHKNIQEDFFNWCLSNNNEVRQFIEFPMTCARLKAAYLAPRIGRLGGHLFRIEKRQINPHSAEKIATLPFYNEKRKIERISILDDSLKVTLEAGWRLSISKIFKIFAKKKSDTVDLEFFGSRGIANWNNFEMGGWNPALKTYERLDFTPASWWEGLPEVEVVSRQDLEARYKEPLQPREWLVCVKSTRQYPGLDIDKTHGYLEISIPTKQGKYAVYSFGKYPEKFPEAWWEVLGFLLATVPGKVSYPDEAIYHSHRQQASYPIKLTAKQGLDLMQLIKRDIISSLQNQSIFQNGYENCAYWAQANVAKVYPHPLPNFFRLPILKSEPGNLILGGLFDLLRMFPKSVQVPFFNGLTNILGASKGINIVENGKLVPKAISLTPFPQEQAIFQPGYLNTQIAQAKIKGTLSIGH